MRPIQRAEQIAPGSTGSCSRLAYPLKILWIKFYRTEPRHRNLVLGRHVVSRATQTLVGPASDGTALAIKWPWPLVPLAKSPSLKCSEQTTLQCDGAHAGERHTARAHSSLRSRCLGNLVHNFSVNDHYSICTNISTEHVKEQCDWIVCTYIYSTERTLLFPFLVLSSIEGKFIVCLSFTS